MTNILIVGVGGQGTLLASRIIGSYALSSGFDVKLSEVHGMAQRGGSVVTHVRIGENVRSPLIDEGEADCIVAFELLEAIRWLPYLKKGGTLIVNDQEILPMPVITGAVKYPADILGQLNALGVKVISLDALKLAAESGSIKAINTVLLGVLARVMGWDNAACEQALADTVKPAFLALNKAAFAKGYGGER